MARLCICSNRGDGGLLDGHSWIELTDNSGGTHTHGTWGNRTPPGRRRDEELKPGGYGNHPHGPGTVCCCRDLTPEQLAAFAGWMDTEESQEWGKLNNCAAFAANAWKAAGGCELDPENFIGIPNPNSLADAIVDNCVSCGGTLENIPSASGGSSSGSGGPP